MKNLIKISIVLLVVVITSCRREEVLEDNLPPDRAMTLSGPRIKLEGRWKGMPDNDCQLNGTCGPCRGICISIVFSIVGDNATLSQQEINDGMIFGHVQLGTGGTTLLFEPEESVDDGNGVVVIEEDFDVGEEVADAFNLSSVIIESGTYSINYNYGSHGRIVFSLL